MTKIYADSCYLCGKKATTFDHVPPKNLSPATPNSEFWLLPACHSCNTGYSEEESKVRDMIAAGTAYWRPSATHSWEKALRNFERGSERRGSSPSVNKKRILDNLEPVFIEGKDGTVKIAQRLKHPKDVNSEAVFTKIAKGLFYAHQQSRVDESIEPQFFWLNDGITDAQLKAWEKFPIRVQVGDFFQYIGAIAEDNKTSAWLMSFHKTLVVAVTFIAE